MRIVFMGTPDFSVPALKALVEVGHQVIAVVTQPDKPKGRGKEVQMTPVKIQAMEYGIPVYQPAKVREASFVEVLQGMEADVYVVIAFGQLLPKAVLELPKYGCINIHASLLPKYRGAAPIQWCVIDGERETGIPIPSATPDTPGGIEPSPASVPCSTGSMPYSARAMSAGSQPKPSTGTAIASTATGGKVCPIAAMVSTSGRTAGGRGADHHHDPAGSAVAVCRPALRDAAGGRCRRQALRYAAFCRSAAPGDEP